MNIYDKKRQEIKVKFKQCVEIVEKNNKKLDVLFKQKEDETKELRAKLGAIMKRFDKLISPLQKENEKADDFSKYKFQFEQREIEEQEKVDMSKKKGKFDVESFRAFLALNGIFRCDRHMDDSITEKKSLNNGIQIFKVHDDMRYFMWFAFRGLDLVGVSYRRQGLHRGDDTYPFSFIGSLGISKQLMVLKPDRLSLGCGKNEMTKQFATFTDWRRILEREGNKAEVILMDKVVIDCLREKRSLEHKTGGRGWY